MTTTGFNIVFETERLIVRRYHAEDKENFFLMNGDEEIVRYIRQAKSREESDLFLLQVMEYAEEHPLFGRWAVNEKESGDFVGTFAVIPVNGTDNLQLGYSFIKTVWGKGYATELTKAGVDYFFQKTRHHEIYALTESENIPSQKVLLKSGFIQSGHISKDGGKEILEFIYKRAEP
ncbi:MAG: family N-acetyltransferase [Chitinophagaceae bacterium]|nr:family N-acetyltransferase [Chitinophagaceae bacterium]